MSKEVGIAVKRNHPLFFLAGSIGILASGCASPSLSSRLASLEARNDSLLIEVRGLRKEFAKIDSLEKDVKGVRVLTDFLSAKILANAQAATQRDQAAPVDIPLEGSFSTGPDSARMTIVEFSDLECVYCAQATMVMDSLRKAYPAEIKVIYKHFPLDFHKNAKGAAAASIAAGKQGKFFEFKKVVQGTRHDWSESAYLAMAKSLGLDLVRFKKDMVLDAEKESLLARDMALGTRLGVQGTPTIFVNGRRVEQRSFRHLERLLKQMKS